MSAVSAGEVIPALLAAAALGLLLPPAPSRLPASPYAVGSLGRARRGPLLVGSLAMLVLAAAVLSPAGLVLALIAAAVAAGALRLLAARRRDRAAAAHRARVIDLCDVLRAELSAGRTPGAALDHAATEWPFIAPAARTADAGGDVPAMLRTLADHPGAEPLRVVAAAWQVAHRTGHGLADVLARVTADLRAAEHTRRVVAGELASARATARLLAVLPVVALLIGAGAGAGSTPWRFLVTQPAGLGCLGAGLAFSYAGLAWIEALARDVDRVA